MFPLVSLLITLFGMNRRIDELAIRALCRELLATDRHVSGRALRRALRDRFDVAGNTQRVFGIWREGVAARDKAASPTTTAQAILNIARSPGNALREQLRTQPKYAQEVLRLQGEVARLTVELKVARRSTVPLTVSSIR